jgi:hypothetical protein
MENLKIYFSSGSEKLPLEFLQIRPSSLKALKAKGHLYISDILIGWEMLQLEVDETHLTHITGVIDAFVRASEGVGITVGEKSSKFKFGPLGISTNWLHFYDDIFPDYHYLAFRCREFEILEATGLNFPITKERFGMGAVNLFGTYGTEDFLNLKKLLGKGPVALPYAMGKKKLETFFLGLIELASEVRKQEYGIDYDRLNEKEAQESLAMRLRNNKFPVPVQRALTPETILQTRLGQLHVGVKLPHFENAGIHTVADFLNFQIGKNRYQILSVGKKTFDLIDDYISSMKNHLDDNGDIDWKKYFYSRGIGYFDFDDLQSKYPTNADDFIEPIRAVMAQYFQSDFNICFGRLLAKPGQQISLEECGRKYQPPLTRERVRQRESKILKTLGDTLIDGQYEKAGFHFSEAVSEAWGKLFDNLRGKRPTHSIVQKALTDLFEIKTLEAFNILNLAIGILSGSIPATRKYFFKLPENAIALLQDQTKVAQRLSALYLDKKIQRTLEMHQLYFVSDLMQFVLSWQDHSTLNTSEIRAIGETCRHIDILQRTSKNRESFNLDAYARDLGIEFFPLESKGGADKFFRSIKTIFKRILSLYDYAGVEDLLERRIIKSLEARETFAVIAADNNCNIQTVIRNQERILIILNEFFVEEKVNNDQIHIRTWFTNHMSVCRGLFLSGDQNFESFVDALREEFKVPLDQYNDEIWGLWTIFRQKVFANSSKGIKGISRSSSLRYNPLADDEIIVLRGFKRLH